MIDQSPQEGGGPTQTSPPTKVGVVWPCLRGLWGTPVRISGTSPPPRGHNPSEAGTDDEARASSGASLPAGHAKAPAGAPLFGHRGSPWHPNSSRGPPHTHICLSQASPTVVHQELPTGSMHRAGAPLEARRRVHACRTHPAGRPPGATRVDQNKPPPSTYVAQAREPDPGLWDSRGLQDPCASLRGAYLESEPNARARDAGDEDQAHAGPRTERRDEQTVTLGPSSALHRLAPPPPFIGLPGRAPKSSDWLLQTGARPKCRGYWSSAAKGWGRPLGEERKGKGRGGGVLAPPPALPCPVLPRATRPCLLAGLWGPEFSRSILAADPRAPQS